MAPARTCPRSPRPCSRTRSASLRGVYRPGLQRRLPGRLLRRLHATVGAGGPAVDGRPVPQRAGHPALHRVGDEWQEASRNPSPRARSRRASRRTCRRPPRPRRPLWPKGRSTISSTRRPRARSSTSCAPRTGRGVPHLRRPRSPHGRRRRPAAHRHPAGLDAELLRRRAHGHGVLVHQPPAGRLTPPQGATAEGSQAQRGYRTQQERPWQDARAAFDGPTPGRYSAMRFQFAMFQ